MSENVFHLALERIVEYLRHSQQDHINIVFHGGEPTLLDVDTFDAWCVLARTAAKSANATLSFAIQTNATLLNDRWVAVLRRHDVRVGVSIDGLPAIHDAHRVDHAGRGSYAAVTDGLRALERGDVAFSLLCVIPDVSNPLEIHRHLLSWHPRQIDYLFPDRNYKAITYDVRTPCADFLIPIFDEWCEAVARGNTSVRIPVLAQVTRLVLGGVSELDIFGNGALPFLFVEADGSIEGLDVLRVCGHAAAATGLNVREHRLTDVTSYSGLHSAVLNGTVPPPTECCSCDEFLTCRGGYLPHRFRGDGFDHRSYWCDDIRKLFQHVRARLGVSADETRLRRQVLQEMNAC
jgi:uncharacterized protein